MFRPYPIFIGLRYTAAKRSNHFISFISLTSMIGLTLGVAVLITVMSVMNGFDRELKERILGMVPHAVIKHYGNMNDWQSIDDLTTKRPDVIAAAPFIKAQGMVTHGSGVRGILMNGVLPKEEDDVSIISDHMVSGSIHDLKAGEFGIVIGGLLASHLRVDIGDKITIGADLQLCLLPQPHDKGQVYIGIHSRDNEFVKKSLFKQLVRDLNYD